MYSWVSMIHLLTYIFQLTPTTLHGLVHMWLVGISLHIVSPLSMFQYERELDNFTKGRKKYNDMDSIMKLVEKVNDRCGGWERDL